MLIPIQKFKGTRFGSKEKLSDESLCALYDIVHSRPISSREYEKAVLGNYEGLSDSVHQESPSTLGGRGIITVASVADFGSVVVKHYSRGGLLRFVAGGTYLKNGATRGQQEYETLCEVKEMGVNVPDPVAFAFKGKLFYKAWLVTKEIPGRRTLVELSAMDEDLCFDALESLIFQFSLLIKNRIFHVDLHPGNVVVDRNKTVFILDFDKAYKFQGSLNRLRDLYLRRWRRAVIKHKLPDYLSERVCLGLRQNFEEGSVAV